MDSTPAFSWRREWALLLLPIALGLLVRVPLLGHARAYCSSDTAIIGLMAKHLGEGTALPPYYYGQAYIGSFGAVLAAPFQRLHPGDPRALGEAHLVLFSLTLLLCYRLLFTIGGRAGALAGTLLLAAPTPWVAELTTGRLLGYLESLWVGALILWVGTRLIERVTTPRLAAFGVLCGFAWWVNPQIATIIAPVVVALWARGNLVRLRGEGRLNRTLGPRWTHRLHLGLALIGIAIGAVLWSCLVGPLRIQLGDKALSLSRPERYLVRPFVALAALLAGYELLLASDRRRWLRRAALFGLAAAVGLAPAIAAKLSGQSLGPKAPTGLDPTRIPAQWGPLIGLARSVVWGDPRPWGLERLELPWLQTVYTSLRWLLVLSLSAAGAAALWAQRGAVLLLLRVRPVSLPLPVLFAGQATLLCGLFLLLTGEGASRYFVQLWLPIAGLAAWAVRRLVVVGRGGLATLWIALWLAHNGVALALHSQVHLPALDTGASARLIARLEADGLTRGEAGYWLAYRLTYLADERVIVSVAPGTGELRIRWHDAEVGRATRVFRLFDTADAADRAREASWLAEHGNAVTSTWRSDGVRVYVHQRPPRPARGRP